MANFAGLRLIAIPLIGRRGVPCLGPHVCPGRIGVMTTGAGQPAGFGFPSSARGGSGVASLAVPNILWKRDVPIPSLHGVAVCVRNSSEGIVQLRAEMDSVNPLGDRVATRPFDGALPGLVVVASATLVNCGIVEYLVMTCIVEHEPPAVWPLVAQSAVAGHRQLLGRRAHLECLLGDRRGLVIGFVDTSTVRDLDTGHVCPGLQVIDRIQGVND